MHAAPAKAPLFFRSGRACSAEHAGVVVLPGQKTLVSLGDYDTEFIKAQVRAGRYGSASEVLRAGLRLLEEHDLKLKNLQDALKAGEESGPPVAFDNDVFLQRMRTATTGGS